MLLKIHYEELFAAFQEALALIEELDPECVHLKVKIRFEDLIQKIEGAQHD